MSNKSTYSARLEWSMYKIVKIIVVCLALNVDSELEKVTLTYTLYKRFGLSII